jgi:Zn-dependent protease
MDCGTPIPPLALECPGCRSLVYKQRLTDLAAEAKQLETAGDLEGAKFVWRQALLLLPAESAQARTIRDHLDGFDLRQAETAPQPEESPVEQEEKKANFLKRFSGPLVGLGLVAWKFKAFLLVLWTKGKFLLFGLGKAKTALSMLASIGVYWTMYGWRYAAGFIIGIYVHEMGHVWVMRRYGMQPTAPMFIPLMGAFVASYRAAENDHQSARVGLAGPIWGLGSAIFCTVMAIATDEGIWRALAQTLAFINLFNLLPIWIFDGGFGFLVLTKLQRLLVGATAVAMMFATGVGLNVFLAMAVGYKVFIAKDNPEKPDWRIAIEYIGLIVALSVLASIPATMRDRM